MKPRFKIEWKKDNEYTVYDWKPSGIYIGESVLFSGSIVEVEAWVSLKNNGYEF